MTRGKNLLNMLLKGEEHAEKGKEITCNKYCTPITINTLPSGSVFLSAGESKRQTSHTQ